MKKITLLLLTLISSSCFSLTLVENTTTTNSCQIVTPWPATNDGEFIRQFENIAYCQCAISTKMPVSYCERLGMKGLYNSLMAKFGDLQRACVYAAKIETRTSKELCVEQWQYYLKVHPLG